MKPINKMTLGELAAFIDTHLRKEGIKVVLSGGASVAIYSKDLYVSKDLDFIGQFILDRKKIDGVMNKLGFNQWGKYYSHSDTPYFVEFISGPPYVGQEPIDDINELSLSTGTIRIISPTDSVKDRLAAYFHWGDRQGLAQAVLVAKTNSIDLESVKAWSIREGKEKEYKDFHERLDI